jgi:hypothetical protein
MKTPIYFPNMVASKEFKGDASSDPYPPQDWTSVPGPRWWSSLRRTTALSSSTPLRTTNDIRSNARRVFVGDTTNPPSRSFKTFPPKPSTARKYNPHSKARRSSPSISRIPQVSNAPAEDIDLLLADMSVLYKSVSSTEVPLVSQRSSISELLHRSFKTLYLLRQAHQKILDIQISRLPVCWRKQALFYYNKAHQSPKQHGSPNPHHRRFFLFHKLGFDCQHLEVHSRLIRELHLKFKDFETAHGVFTNQLQMYVDPQGFMFRELTPSSLSYCCWVSSTL